MAAVLADLRCDLFFNPAALTSLEECEDNPQRAQRINADTPAEIAAWAAARGVKLIHFSTDYVFDGRSPGLRKEAESPNPLNVYGRTKLAGEAAVLSETTNCVIRVSWVFGPERPSFVDSVFDAALAARPLAAVADKFSLPVFTTDLTWWLEEISTHATGIVHACNPGTPVSWHGLATAVVEEMAAAGIISAIPEIVGQSLANMSAFRAERPQFTALATDRLASLLRRPPRPWREALAEYIQSRCSAR